LILPATILFPGIAAAGANADTVDGFHAADFAMAAQTYTKAQVDSLVNGLQAQITVLQGLLQHFSRNGNEVAITGANLHIVSGSGSTAGTVNGLGNLIIGYNEAPTEVRRTGSHNLVIGAENNFTSYAGVAAGQRVEIAAPYAAAVGGINSFISGTNSAVLGGTNGVVDGAYAAIVGGDYNTAHGQSSVVIAGDANQTFFTGSSVLGGIQNVSYADRAVVVGGQQNTATVVDSTVIGGQ
jgi:hypothetical protein